MTKQVIPAQAVEAAMIAFANAPYDPPPTTEAQINRANQEQMKLALEAAAPHMIQTAKAEAWEEGREYGIDECAGDVTGGINPHRKEAL